MRLDKSEQVSGMKWRFARHSFSRDAIIFVVTILSGGLLVLSSHITFARAPQNGGGAAQAAQANQDDPHNFIDLNGNNVTRAQGAASAITSGPRQAIHTGRKLHSDAITAWR